MQTTETLQTKSSDTVLKFQAQYYFTARYFWILIGSQAQSRTVDINESFTPVLGERNNPVCSNELLITPLI